MVHRDPRVVQGHRAPVVQLEVREQQDLVVLRALQVLVGQQGLQAQVGLVVLQVRVVPRVPV